MKKKKAVRYAVCTGVLIILTAALFMMSLSSGSSGIGISGLMGVFTGKNADETIRRIILGIRFPRAAAALMLGGGLSVSGYLLQSYFGNPIAGPYILGISSGAKLMTAMVMIVSLKTGVLLGSAAMTAAAFAGALFSMVIILGAAGKVKNMAQLIIAGVMIGYICNAVTEIAVTFADDANIVNLHNWSMGSFSGISIGNVRFFSVMILTGLAAAVLLAKPMSAYRLGESYAVSMGVNIRSFRVMLILLSSMMSGCVTAFAGPVSFVGVAVPHMVKGMYGSSEPLVIIPASFIGGGAFCMLCDLIARTVFSPLELSVSTVTAVFGAPVVIMIMLDRRNGGTK